MSRPKGTQVREAAAPDPAALVPGPIQARNLDAVASPAGVNKLPVADVDAVVTKAVEEDEIARLELIP